LEPFYAPESGAMLEGGKRHGLALRTVALTTYFWLMLVGAPEAFLAVQRPSLSFKVRADGSRRSSATPRSAGMVAEEVESLEDVQVEQDPMVVKHDLYKKEKWSVFMSPEPSKVKEPVKIRLVKHGRAAIDAVGEQKVMLATKAVRYVMADYGRFFERIDGSLAMRPELLLDDTKEEDLYIMRVNISPVIISGPADAEPDPVFTRRPEMGFAACRKDILASVKATGRATILGLGARQVNAMMKAIFMVNVQLMEDAEIEGTDPKVLWAVQSNFVQEGNSEEEPLTYLRLDLSLAPP